MRKKFFLAILSLIFIKDGYSQSTTFEGTWGTSGVEYAFQVEELASGEYFFLSSIGYGKMTNFLTLQWFQNDSFYTPEAFVETQDGGIAIISNRFGSVPRVFKINTSGNVLWSYQMQNNGTLYSIDESGNGDLVIIYKNYAPPNYESGVIRLNTSGAFMWNVQFTTNGQFIPKRLKATSDGGAVVCGQQDYAPSNPNLVIYKCDASGTLQWYKEYEGGYYEFPESIVEIPGVGYACAGYFIDTLYRILACKLDLSGNVTWSKHYTDGNYQMGSSLKLLGNGGLIITGIYRNWPSVPSGEGIIVRLDGSGNLVWSKRYGGNQQDSLAYITLTSGNGHLACGTTTSYGMGLRDLYFVKTDSSGSNGCQSNVTMTTVNLPLTVTSSNFSSSSNALIPVSLIPDPVTIQGYAFCFTSVEEQSSITAFSAIFDPSIGVISMNIDLSKSAALDISLYDVTGRLVYRRHPGFVSGVYKEEVNVIGLRDGIYIVNLLIGDQLYSRKVLVVR